jgi:hypothetical protein
MDITELMDDVDERELSVVLPEVLRGVERERVRDLIMTACELEHQVGEPLTAAWLELDNCRSALGDTDHPAILGRLELAAALVREAAFNLLTASAKCRTAALDGQVVECG